MTDDSKERILGNILKANEVVVTMIADTRKYLLGVNDDSAEDYTSALRHAEATRNCLKKAMGEKRGRSKKPSG